MITIIISAILCAVCTLYLVIPIAGKHKRITHGMMVLLPLSALGLYLLMGSPSLPGSPALFEKEGPRAQQRSLVEEELQVMRALAEDPDNPELMLALGSLRIANDRFEDAITILEHARTIAPKNQDILLQLGAAYFVTGLFHAESNEREQASASFQKALKLAPKNAPYMTDLKKIIESFE